MTTALTLLSETLAICRLPGEASVPDWAAAGAFFSLTRTAEELSLVCRQAAVPADVTSEPDWRCLKVEGVLDFALTGVLAALAAPLAQAEIPIFALSTYNTDYLLVKAQHLARAIEVLRQAGHTVDTAAAC